MAQQPTPGRGDLLRRRNREKTPRPRRRGKNSSSRRWRKTTMLPPAACAGPSLVGGWAVPRSALRGAARLGEWVDRHSDLSTAIQHPGFPVHWPCRLLRRGFSLAFPWASATIVINDSHCSTPCAYIANQRNVADEPAQSAAPLKAERAKGAGLSVRQRLPLLLR
jgi:hypothetical protein